MVYFKLLYMCYLFKCFFFSLFFIAFNVIPSFCQKKIQQKIEIGYRLIDQDSIIRYRKNTVYDTIGRAITKKNFFYHSKLKDVLTKEERSYFNNQDQVLTEKIITYQVGKDPESKKMVTKYLDYGVKEKESKRIYRKLYDDYMDLLREDTLTYDTNKNLIQLCNYDYRGNTSLLCHYYSYNKKGLLKRWRTYSKWTTINGRGDVVNRKAKRRDARMIYNKREQLTCSKEKHYRNRAIRKVKYDKIGNILEDKSIRRIKIRLSPQKGNSKKYKVDYEKHVITYVNGMYISDVKHLNNVEINKEACEYQDSLPVLITNTQNRILLEQQKIEYNTVGIKTKKTHTKYTKKGQVRYSLITFYNKRGYPIREEQVSGNKILSVLVMKYDEEGNRISNSLSYDNRKSFEKTKFIYTYY